MDAANRPLLSTIGISLYAYPFSGPLYPFALGRVADPWRAWAAPRGKYDPWNEWGLEDQWREWFKWNLPLSSLGATCPPVYDWEQDTHIYRVHP